MNIRNKKRKLRTLALKLLALKNHENFSGEKIKKLKQQIISILNNLRSVVQLTELKKIVGAAAVFLGSSFINNSYSQQFAAPQQNPFGLSPANELPVPAMADMDNDGDIDLLIGGYYGNFAYSENTGTATNPVFSDTVTNPFGLLPTYGFSFPALTDLDNDGDYDLLVVEYYGNIKYYENTGTPSLPSLDASVDLPFGLSAVYAFGIPAFADIDDDGDQDLFVGEYYGDMIYFYNNGTPTAPSFAPQVTNPFGLTAVQLIGAPAFADLDVDGDLDLLIGEYYGNLKYFENTGTATAPLFLAPQTNPFGIQAAYYIAFPVFADMDDDGDQDLFVFEYYGNTNYYENISPSGVEEKTNGSGITVFPNPCNEVISIENIENNSVIVITDETGRIVKSVIKTSENIDVGQLKGGIYFIKVTNQNGTVSVQKFIKQ